MNGHVVDDMLLYHAHIYFSWSLLYEGTNANLWMSSNEWFRPHTSTTQDLSMRAHRHYAKVTSFYLRSLAKPVEHWLCFECCLAFLVLLIGLLTSEATFKRWCHLPPLHIHEDLSSRTTLFQVGGDDTGRPSVLSASWSSSRTTLKSDVTEAWKRRRKKETRLGRLALPPRNGRHYRPARRRRKTALSPCLRRHRRPHYEAHKLNHPTMLFVCLNYPSLVAPYI